MEFHDVQFPTAISFGSSGGPERRTEIVTLANGHEERNTPWESSRRHYDAGTGLRSVQDLEAVIAFFEARRGQLHAFRWKDWLDFRSAASSEAVLATDQVIGTGDGTNRTFQLVKTYASGGESYARTITKPVGGTVAVAVDGVSQSALTVDYWTGTVTFDDAPQAGAVITAGFEFDVPARFDTDRIEASLASFNVGEIPSIPVIEVRV